MGLDNYIISSYNSIINNQAVDRKKWKYTGDYRNNSEHCRNHASLDGTVIPKDEPFTLVGLSGETYYPLHPRDPSLPAEEREQCLCIVQGIAADSVVFLSLAERERIQAKAVAEDDGEWEKELRAKSRAKAGIDK